MSDVSDHLILSVKWSRNSELLVWYRPNSIGYTESVDEAGRYTEAEAKRVEGQCSGNTLAVPVAVAESLAKRVVRADLLSQVKAVAAGVTTPAAEVAAHDERERPAGTGR